MGIRFEYGSRKATNGPMIFFSDPVSEVNLQEEIRGAIDSRLCFYAYHLPGDLMVSFGSSEGAVEGIGQPGFVISPFLPDHLSYTIPYAPTPRNNAQEQYPFPIASTSSEEYYAEIDAIQQSIRGEEDQKIVAARVRIEHARMDVAATFLKLTKSYPDAYVFCFSTPQTGCWIGASPELLLSSLQGKFTTMALAGTRPAYTPGPWDLKNQREQQMVTDYVENCLKDNGLSVSVKGPSTRNAGSIEHICSDITATTTYKDFSTDNLIRLIGSLSPTPATAGVPKDLALRIITTQEKFKRAFYGGFCGPFRSVDDFTFFVMLRSGRVEVDRFALFAGGGITALSEKETEWEETEMKLDTLRTNILEENVTAL